MEEFLLSFFAMTKPQFRRHATFRWFCVVLLGIMKRDDKLGVTSIIRSLRLHFRHYPSLVHFFRSTAWDGTRLLAGTVKWSHEQGCTLRYGRRIVLLVDDSHVPKEGVRMPQVGTIRQTSETSAKPSHFRGHTWGAVALLSEAGGKAFAVPAKFRIYEPGVKAQEDGSSRTEMLVSDAVGVAGELKEQAYVVGDAWFNNQTAVKCVRKTDGKVELISRARIDAVGYELPKPANGEPKRGRKPTYGKKVKMRELFASSKTPFTECSATLYGQKEKVQLYAVNLLRKSSGMIRFILAKTRRGRIVVTSTDLMIDPVTALEIYAKRSPIEELFSGAKNIVGAETGHFWTKALVPVPRRPGRNKPRACSSPGALKKAEEAHLNHLCLCLVSLALLQLLAAKFGKEIAGVADFWTRTPSKATPSPRVTRKAASIVLGEFLQGQAWMRAEGSIKKEGVEAPGKLGSAAA